MTSAFKTDEVTIGGEEDGLIVYASIVQNIVADTTEIYITGTESTYVHLHHTKHRSSITFIHTHGMIASSKHINKKSTPRHKTIR